MMIKNIFSDVSYIEPEIYKDDRGFFSEIYNEELFKKNNLKINYIQDNFSSSKLKNTIRGLHFQKKPFEQTKLIKVINGSILDVFVDLREESNNFGAHSSIELTQDMGWVLIPKGFAHGFKTLENNTSVLYKVDEFYNKENDSGIIWNDNFLNIDWNLSSDPVLSDKDKNLPNWDSIITGLKE